MGTYIRFKQNDPSLIDETNKLLHSIKDKDEIICHVTDADDREWQMERCKCYLTELGEGDLKISGSTYVEDTYRPLGIFPLLRRAMDEFGLEVTLPTNADDYMDADDIAIFMTLDDFKAKQDERDAYNERFRTSRDNALRDAHEAHAGIGQMFVKDWGGGGFWLFFAGIEPTDSPRFLEISFEVDGEKHRELYRDENGDAYMPIPLMELGENGPKLVGNFLKEAWKMGLRTRPEEILIAVYRVMPEAVMLLGKKMQPKNPVPHPVYGQTVQMAIINENGEPDLKSMHKITGEDIASGLVLLKPARKSWMGNVWTTRKTLGRMYAIDIEEEVASA